MKIYPFDTLPVVITQLQSRSKDKAQKMEKAIRDIFDKYLDHKIVKKQKLKIFFLEMIKMNILTM